MSGQEPITGKVAAVLSPRRLVINRGTDHGVEQGMRFRVLESVNITDPDTGEGLGELPNEVVQVKVIEVASRYAVAHTFETFPLHSTEEKSLVQRLAENRWEVRRLLTPDEALKERGADDGRRFAVVDRGYLVEQTAA